MKIQRHIGLPEGDMAIILDNQTLIHNIVTSELEQKDKEIDRLNNIIDKTKENINDNINLLKTGVKRNSKHITITEAISILETILIQMN